MRKHRYAVIGFKSEFVEELKSFYESLAALGARYRFTCRHGRCWSIIEGGEDVGILLSATPGLIVEECRPTCRESGVMLPPPPAPVPPRPADVPQGPLVLGYSGGVEVGLPVETLWSHVGVFGATGSGKSHTSARLLRCASEAGDAAGLVLDWHNEYHRLVPGATLFSGKALPPVPLVSDMLSVDDAVEALEEVLGLSRNQSLLLSVLLSAAASGDREAAAVLLERLLGPGQGLTQAADLLAKARDMRGLLRAAMEAYRARGPEAPRGELEAWAALLRRLAMLALDERYTRLFTLRSNQASLPLEESKVSIIDLSSIFNPTVRKLYAMLLLESLYLASLHSTTPPLLTVVEEAHHYAGSTALARVLGEARKYRLGVVVVTHTPHMLEHRVLANINTLIVHRTVAAEDIRLLEEILPEATSYSASKLPSGVAILYTAGISEPVLLLVERPEADC